MEEKFKQLIQLLQLADIRFMDSHESVLHIPENILPDSNTSLESGQAFDKESPIIKGDCLLFRVKYVFSFLNNKEPYFKAEYISAATTYGSTTYLFTHSESKLRFTGLII